MPALTFTIALQQPLLSTALLGDPNSTVSHSYIPGSALRGLFAHSYLRQKRLADGSDDASFRPLFLDGQVRFLNAYPLSASGERLLPTAAGLFMRKGDDGGAYALYNASHASADTAARRNFLGQERAKSVSRPFCHLEGTTLHLHKAAHTLAIHVQRDRPKGRAWIEGAGLPGETPHGTVFQYEALAANQWFGAAIVTDDEAHLEQIHALFVEGAFWLGRSRSANYGRVTLSQPVPDNTWREVPSGATPVGDEWTLALLSDTILRDQEGQAVTFPTSAVMSAYLGTNVSLIADRTFTQPTIVGGFNRTWRTPTLQSYALQAGGVIAFRAAKPLDSALVRRLEQQGIGERRAEGFGRLAFNWLPARELHGHEQNNYQPAQPPREPASSSALSEQERGLAKQMADRLLDQAIDGAITRFVQSHVWPLVTITSDAMPSNSQLARLRVLVRQMLPLADVAAVKRQFAAFRPAAMGGYERARFRGTSLKEWIERLLNTPNGVWAQLFADESWIDACVVAQQRPTLTEKANATVLRLLSAVLAAPARKRNDVIVSPVAGA